MSENFTAFRTVFIGNLKNFGKEKKFSEDSAKLKKYLQKGLFEQRICIFIIFCSRRAPHLGHVILVLVGGELLLNGGILKIIKKLTQ